MKFLEKKIVKSEKQEELWREMEQINEKYEERIRLKKKFEYTRKRSGENIQEEEEGLELRK